MLSEVFWTFVVTTGAGLIFGVSKLCFKSKCVEVDFLCLRVIRDTTEESDVSDDDETNTCGDAQDSNSKLNSIK